MLDIRADHYVSPLSEVEFASVKLTVTLHNYADETGLVQGKFRVYNDETGLLIHTSDIAPATLSAGQTLDVSALTDFDPPAPADDTYFVMFEGHASNALVPRGIDFFLGSFYFDVKPVGMGPAPAAHHATHELGGSDEVNVTGLLGVLSDKQPPQTHGNAAHTAAFEDQTNKGAAGGYCGLPDPLDPSQPLRADGTPAQPDGLHEHLDLLASSYHPWSATAIGGGGIGSVAGSSNHPGIRRISSAAAANSGGSILTATDALLIAGSEVCQAHIRPQTLTNTTIRFGLLDTTSSAAPTDGAYIEIANVAGTDGVLLGKTASNATRSTTATSYTLTTNTWYHILIKVNADATRVDYYLYSESGTLLWTDSLTTNIPTTTGRETGHGLIATTSGSSVVNLLDVDHVTLDINRALVR